MAYTGVRHFDVPDLHGVRNGLLLVSNHQSFLDPLLLGMALEVQICYLARKSLFEVAGMGALLWGLNTYPVRRGQVDPGALKTILKLLRTGQRVVMFPEGTRTHDGSLGTFRPGAAAMAIRTGVPVLPVCIEGAFRCWPRTSVLPRPARVAVAYGSLMPPEGDAAALTERIRLEIAAMQRRLRLYLGYEEETDGLLRGAA